LPRLISWYIDDAEPNTHFGRGKPTPLLRSSTGSRFKVHV
jgi:hypothetical protein